MRTIMDDPLIWNHIEDLLKNFLTQVLLKLIKPYTRIRIPFISKELNVPEIDVEKLFVSLILDNRIDQVERNEEVCCYRQMEHTAEITLSNHRQPSILKIVSVISCDEALSSLLLYRERDSNKCMPVLQCNL